MWNRIDTPVGLLRVLNDKFSEAGNRDATALPDLSRSGTLLVSSDFSGEHETCPFSCLSVLLTGGDTWKNWEESRKATRERHGLEKRRMSYAKLGDGIKAKGLNDFLTSADRLNGVLACLVVDKDVTSLFDGTGKIDLNEWGLNNWAHWKISTFERMLRAVHFVAFLAAGLSRPDQNVIWIADEDEMAANKSRQDEVTANLTYILDRYLPHQLRHLRFGTTALDEGTLDIEDLAAIPDLVGGAMVENFAAYRAMGIDPTSGLMLLEPHNLPKKAEKILRWFSKSPDLLRRFMFLILPGGTVGQIEVTSFSFFERPLVYGY